MQVNPGYIPKHQINKTKKTVSYWEKNPKISFIPRQNDVVKLKGFKKTNTRTYKSEKEFFLIEVGRFTDFEAFKENVHSSKKVRQLNSLMPAIKAPNGQFYFPVEKSEYNTLVSQNIITAHSTTGQISHTTIPTMPPTPVNHTISLGDFDQASEIMGTLINNGIIPQWSKAEGEDPNYTFTLTPFQYQQYQQLRSQQPPMNTGLYPQPPVSHIQTDWFQGHQPNYSQPNFQPLIPPRTGPQVSPQTPVEIRIGRGLRDKLKQNGIQVYLYETYQGSDDWRGKLSFKDLQKAIQLRLLSINGLSYLAQSAPHILNALNHTPVSSGHSPQSTITPSSSPQVSPHTLVEIKIGRGLKSRLAQNGIIVNTYETYQSSNDWRGKLSFQDLQKAIQLRLLSINGLSYLAQSAPHILNALQTQPTTVPTSYSGPVSSPTSSQVNGIPGDCHVVFQDHIQGGPQGHQEKKTLQGYNWRTHYDPQKQYSGTVIAHRGTFSNFSQTPITFFHPLGGQYTYPTPEHMFHSLKIDPYNDPVKAMSYIGNQQRPHGLPKGMRKLGGTPWSNQKIAYWDNTAGPIAMLYVQLVKAQTDPTFHQALLSVNQNNLYVIEDTSGNPYGEFNWGDGGGLQNPKTGQNGKNNLGKTQVFAAQILAGHAQHIQWPGFNSSGLNIDLSLQGNPQAQIAKVQQALAHVLRKFHHMR